MTQTGSAPPRDFTLNNPRPMILKAILANTTAALLLPTLDVGAHHDLGE
jgi:hypothetical protein